MGKRQSIGERRQGNQYEALNKPRQALSNAIARLLENASIRDLVSVAPTLATCLSQEALVAESVLPAVRNVMRQAADSRLLMSTTAAEDVSQLCFCMGSLRQ